MVFANLDDKALLLLLVYIFSWLNNKIKRWSKSVFLFVANYIERFFLGMVKNRKLLSLFFDSFKSLLMSYAIFFMWFHNYNHDESRNITIEKFLFSSLSCYCPIKKTFFFLLFFYRSYWRIIMRFCTGSKWFSVWVSESRGHLKICWPILLTSVWKRKIESNQKEAKRKAFSFSGVWEKLIERNLMWRNDSVGERKWEQRNLNWREWDWVNGNWKSLEKHYYSAVHSTQCESDEDWLLIIWKIQSL